MLEMKDALAKTKFVVEATSCETHMLWEKFCKQTIYPIPGHSVYEWEQINTGFLETVGNVNGDPVVISVRWFLIEGVLVMFYEATSQVVDHRMVEAWLDEHCSPRWCRGSRPAKTSAMNFHHVLDYVRHPDQR